MRFLFLDIETTGLDPSYHKVIEVGAVLTDEKGDELGRMHTYVNPGLPVEDWDPWCQEQHAKTGLTVQCFTGVELPHIELFKFLTEHAAVNKDTLVAGSSVHFDVSFLPDFPWHLLSHRRLDLSTLRTLDKVAGTGFWKRGEGVEPAHTALEDIAVDIEHFKQATFLFQRLKGSET